MELELCAGSYGSALLANQFPFKRIELCASLESGGLTPTAGTIVKVVKEVKAECHVLIRPRAGDFTYTEEEIEVMHADIEFCKTVGCKGVVFGVLDHQSKFDLEKNLYLLEAAGQMETTFHRAIDISTGLEKDIESIINCGFTRILSSGLANSALEGIETLKKMKQLTKDRVELMIGGGVKADNIQLLRTSVNPDAIHFSATEKHVSAVNQLFEQVILETSLNKLKHIFKALD